MVVFSICLKKYLLYTLRVTCQVWRIKKISLISHQIITIQHSYKKNARVKCGAATIADQADFVLFC